MNVMTLGNMKAKIVFGQDAKLFRGEILSLTGSTDFYGKTVAGLKRECKKPDFETGNCLFHRLTWPTIDKNKNV